MAEEIPVEEKSEPIISTIETGVKSESSLKKFAAMLPFLSVLVIAIGLIQEMLYYNNFNLPIEYFIGLPEIGVLFSKNLILISISLFIPLIPSLDDISNIKKIKTISIEKGELIGAIILLITIILTVFVFIRIRSYSNRLWCFGALLSFASFGLICSFPKFLNELKNSFIGVVLLVFFLITFFYLGNTISMDIDKVNNGKYTGTIIKTNDSTYVSTKNSFFIGKTDKYVFIFNRKDSTDLILPTESIKEIIIKEK